MDKHNQTQIDTPMRRLYNSCLIILSTSLLCCCGQDGGHSIQAHPDPKSSLTKAVILPSKPLFETKTYRDQDVMFSLPKEWEVTDNLSTWYFIGITVHTTGVSKIVIDVRKNNHKDDWTNPALISVSGFAESYNQLDEINFLFLGDVYPVETTMVTRAGMQGLRETTEMINSEGDGPRIREFYRIDLENAAAFVVIDAVENEIADFNSGFDWILESVAKPE